MIPDQCGSPGYGRLLRGRGFCRNEMLGCVRMWHTPNEQFEQSYNVMYMMI